jgi:SAM-dependent methyltransferase
VQRRTRAAVLAAVVRRIEQPISASYGFDRGTPVDRPYIEAHLTAHATDVRGRVLEVKDDEYARRYGGSAVTHVDVVDVDPSNPDATIVADLDQPGVLAIDSYDCIILTQVLEFLRPELALVELYRALAPGGVLLITVPFLGRLETPEGDRWRPSPDGLRKVLAEVLPAEAVTSVQGRGNLAGALAVLAGLASEESGRPHRRPDDWRFPIVSLARVLKPVPGA